MKTLAAGLTTQSNAAAQAPILAVDIVTLVAGTFRYNSSDATVVFGGNSYANIPIKVGVIAVDSGGNPIEISLAFANQDLGLSSLISTYQFIGATVTIRRLFLGDLTVSQILASGLVIQNHQRDEQWAAFRCLGVKSLLSRQVPARLFSRTCAWEFKSAECGYAGGAAFCSATDSVNGPHEYSNDACVSLNNWTNFGGFLFVLEQ